MQIKVLSTPEHNYESLRTYSPNIPTDGASVATNERFFAYLDSSGSGASIAVLPWSSCGKNHIPVNSPAYQQPVIKAHAQIVQDVVFDPFDMCRLYTCSSDKALKMWTIPRDGLSIDISAPTASFTLASKAPLRGIFPHRSAANLVAVRGSREVALIDTLAGKEISSIQTKDFAADMLHATWSYLGDLLLTATKDKKIKCFDLRASQTAQNTLNSHPGPRFASLHVLSEHQILSAGHSGNDRIFHVWDLRALASPSVSLAVDNSASPLCVAVDTDFQRIFQSGLAESKLRVFNASLECVAEESISVQKFSQDPVKALSLLPKTLCEHHESRLFKLTDKAAQIVSVRGEVDWGEGSSALGKAEETAKEAAKEEAKEEVAVVKDVAGGEMEDIVVNIVDSATSDSTTPTPAAEEATAEQPQLSDERGPQEMVESMVGEVVESALQGVESVEPIADTAGADAPAAVDQQQSKKMVLGGAAVMSSTQWLEGLTLPPGKVPYSPCASTAIATPAASDNTSSAGAGAAEGSVGKAEEKADGTASNRASSRVSSMQSIFRFRHLRGDEAKRENTIFQLTPDLSPLDTSLLACSATHVALPYLRGGGGPIYLGRMGKWGRVAGDAVLLNGHTHPVVDVQFSPHPYPFSDTHPHPLSLLYSGSVDNTVKLWKVGEGVEGVGGVEGVCLSTFPLPQTLRALTPHPTVTSMLAVTHTDAAVRLFDTENGAAVGCVQMEQGPGAGRGGGICNISFSFDGSSLAAAMKDRTLKIADARTASVTQSATLLAPMGVRGLRCVWATKTGSAADPVVVVGGGGSGGRFISLWDVRNLTTPCATKYLDTASGSLLPLYDEALGVVFLVGKGDTIVRGYELVNMDEVMVFDKVFDFPTSASPFAGACMLPKHALQVRDVEVTRILKLTPDSIIPISFKMPRADHRAAFFQDDLFPPVRWGGATVEDWVEGRELKSVYTDLCPADMQKLSLQPVAPPPSATMSKVESYRSSIKKEEEEKMQREQTFNKLQSLALQNAAYHVNKSGGKGKEIGGQMVKAKEEEDDDSDAGWDD
eukprot:gene23800-28824_t